MKNEVTIILSNVNFWYEMEYNLLNLYSPQTVYNDCYRVVSDCPQVQQLKKERNENE